MVWEENKVAVCDHFAREVAHDWLGLDMEVAKHFIGAPSSKELDDVTVDFGT